MPTTKKNNTLAFFLKTIGKNPFVLIGIFCLLITPFVSTACFEMAYLYFCIVIAVGMFCTAAVLHKKGKLTTEHILCMLFVLSLLLRILYILRFQHDERQHDTGEYTDTWGHIGYIKYFFENHFLPPYYDPRLVSAFYNPPLHHFLAAIFLKVVSIVQQTTDFLILAEALQALALFYSLCSTILGLKIAKLLGLQGKAYLVAGSIIILHPINIIFSGSINNDNLCFLLVLGTIYHVIKWYQNPTTKNIVFSAFFMGFSLLAKTSAVYIAAGIGILFLYQFFKQKQWKKYIIQYALFACISIPIGLCWVLRCYLLFDMPLNYIPALGIDTPQYLGTGLYRFFDFSWAQWQVPFLTLDTTNIFVSIFKTSILGEWGITTLHWDNNDTTATLSIIASIFLLVNVLLIVYSIYSAVRVLLHKDAEHFILKICFAVIYCSTMATYLIFCWQFPHMCTTDFRYIPITFLLGALALGGALQQKLCCAKQIIPTTVAFCICSTVYYSILLIV